LTARVATLLPALALARVDGSSPVEYLDANERRLVRTIGREVLAAPSYDLEQLIRRWATLADLRKVSL